MADDEDRSASSGWASPGERIARLEARCTALEKELDEVQAEQSRLGLWLTASGLALSLLLAQGERIAALITRTFG